MSFSGGVYTLPGPALVTGEVVSATENNQFRNDVAGAFNVTMLRNGTSTATANLPMGGYKLTGLGAATTSGDALSYGNAAVVTTLTSTSLTATRVPYAGTGGLLQDASTFTFDGTTLTAGGFSTAGSITLSGGTANGVAYLNGSKVLTTGSALTFDGTKLGVGTASPSQKLDLVSSSGSESYARMSDGTIAFLAGVQPALSGALIGTTSSHPVIFYGYGSEQMRLTSTGLGIGTSSPRNVGGKNLQIVSSGLANLMLQSTGGSGHEYGLYAGTSGEWALYDYTASAERLRIDSSGNLGLGVTPSAWDVYKGSQVIYGALASSANAANNTLFTSNAYYNAGFKFMASGATATAYQQETGAHKWYTTGATTGTAGNAITFTQAMTLDASGNLGIGTSSPSSYSSKTLQVTGSGTDVAIKLTNSTTGSGSASAFDFELNGNDLNYVNRTSTGVQKFWTNATERMRIDSSGNVGIGTSSPENKLDVIGRGRFVQNAAATTGAVIIRQDGTNTIGGYIQWVNNANTVQTGYLGVLPDSTWIFGQSSAERMRIDSSGNLLVGTTSNTTNAKSTFSYDGNSVNGLGIIDSTGTTAGIRYSILFQRGTGTTVGNVSTTTSTTSYNTSSDYRLKENIQPMQNALGVVAQLNPVTYNWKADGSDGQGFIAHELQAIVPDCVTGEKDAVDAEGKPVYQGIDTSFLVATLCKAIQELEARVKQLEGN